jgi:pimeloyl-ACP methyl ester carboxylesterase
MPSPYFNSYQNPVEATLLEDLIGEVIFLHGFTAHYIPNTNDAYRDLVYGDDPLKKFTEAYALDTYLVNSSDYGDEADFFSKFGLEVKNSVKIQFTVREFDITTPALYVRPREGDLMWIPFLKNNGELYEIKFVNTSKDLHALVRSKPYFYELSLEPFKYNDEHITTGVDIIDVVEHLNSYQTTFNLGLGSGNYIINELVYQGTSLGTATATSTASTWDHINKTLIVINTAGTFSNTANIIGATSGATYVLTTHNDINQNFGFDNNTITNETNGVINTTEINPFGSLGSYK